MALNTPTDTAASEQTATAKAIRRQVEYYFSDANYTKDRFMQDTAAKNNGCIPINTLLTFNRLKALAPSPDAIKAAVRDSPVVTVDGDALRKTETPEYLAYCADTALAQRTVCVSGLPSAMSLDEVLAFFRAHCEPIRVAMKRDGHKAFTGTCLLEFKTVAEAEKALQMKIAVPQTTTATDEAENTADEAKRLKPNETPAFLTIITREAYDAARRDKKGAADAKFEAKVKRDFIGKLYRYTAPESFSIADIKKAVPAAAFVDQAQSILRLKYAESWETKEFVTEAGAVALQRLTDDEARAYAAAVQIVRKTGPKGKRQRQAVKSE